MAIRILTGFIFCGAPKGFARIGFNPHQLLEISPTAQTTTLKERKAIGPARNFLRTPAKHVALREIVLQTKGGGGRSINQKLSVKDTINATELRVTWNAEVDTRADFSRVFPSEISYMVIGDVADA